MQILHLHEIFNVTIYNLFYNNLIKNHLQKYIFLSSFRLFNISSNATSCFFVKRSRNKDYGLQTTDYGLQTTDFRPSTFDR